MAFYEYTQVRTHLNHDPLVVADENAPTSDPVRMNGEPRFSLRHSARAIHLGQCPSRCAPKGRL